MQRTHTYTHTYINTHIHMFVYRYKLYIKQVCHIAFRGANVYIVFPAEIHHIANIRIAPPNGFIN